MPSIISTIGYVIEANSTTSSETLVTRGVIACNRPEQSGPLMINFVSFNSDEFQKVNYKCVYLIHGKFVYNKIKSNGESYEELQVINYINLINP
jgi:hypothetical protein